MRSKNKIKWLYKIENKAILPKFFYYKIIYLKICKDLDNLYKSYINSVVTVNVYKLTIY